MSDQFAPSWYRERQSALHQEQRDCWSYCPPESKRHPLCDKHFVAVAQEIAACERDRAIAFIRAAGFDDLAERMKRELP